MPMSRCVDAAPSRLKDGGRNFTPEGRKWPATTTSRMRVKLREDIFSTSSKEINNGGTYLEAVPRIIAEFLRLMDEVLKCYLLSLMERGWLAERQSDG